MMLATAGPVASGEASVLGSVAVVIASVIIILQNRAQTKKVEKVKNTLTSPNGGSHVKDQLDRIENRIESLDLRTEILERSSSRVESTLNRHLLWSQGITETLDKRLREVEGKDNNDEGQGTLI